VLAAADEQLRGAGLSRAKTAAVKDLALKARDGDVPSLAALRRMDDDAIVEHLTAIRGIGRWTVEMNAHLPSGPARRAAVHDYGVRNGFRIAYGRRAMPTPKELTRFGEKWRPHRTVASWYLWRAVERSRGGRGDGAGLAAAVLRSGRDA